MVFQKEECGITYIKAIPQGFMCANGYWAHDALCINLQSVMKQLI
ncbi:hypothetical protein HMPREF0658_1917 [Hoylesella marshii DSM 16973 = JCM 13450]|uniref:Uncharacterized protein n=1 Tax=Hoylesella marshii DSM 16973 = JCM 13450 TaxID=862515 RepID=E0NUR2_9BACT|nr:hypothetical protein HMPREF0658_1917 [Hoylesella marshii DSM 16973 = JCM 13450]